MGGPTEPAPEELQMLALMTLNAAYLDWVTLIIDTLPCIAVLGIKCKWAGQPSLPNHGTLAPQTPHYFVNETVSFPALLVVCVHTKSEHPTWAVNVLSM
jgi:hypothetical protein